MTFLATFWAWLLSLFRFHHNPHNRCDSIHNYSNLSVRLLVLLLLLLFKTLPAYVRKWTAAVTARTMTPRMDGWLIGKENPKETTVSVLSMWLADAGIYVSGGTHQGNSCSHRLVSCRSVSESLYTQYRIVLLNWMFLISSTDFFY